MKEEWYASDNEETFNAGPYGSKEEALKEAGSSLDLEEGQEFYVGKKESYSPKICGERVLGDLQEKAWDSMADIVGGWLDHVSPAEEDELSLELTATFTMWAEKHGHTPIFFLIDGATQHTWRGNGTGTKP